MINKKWDIILKDEMKKPYFRDLGIFVKNEYGKKIVFPEYKNIFNALRYTDYDEVKVVILGQDPYHGDGEAHGLSFSVHDNIKRENNDLTDWAKQGVFLLNSIMTVVKDTPLSHKGKGWEIFTDDLIKILNEREKPIVFILWGSYARSKKELITNPNHYIIL